LLKKHNSTLKRQCGNFSMLITTASQIWMFCKNCQMIQRIPMIQKRL